MLDQLNFAPCGYMIIDRQGNILAMNQTLKRIINLDEKDEKPKHMHALLTKSSLLYYQTYFLPLLDVTGAVNEIYLTLRRSSGKVPVLMSAVEREEEGESRIECALMEMSVRDAYEAEIFQEKRNAIRTLKETDEANVKLQKLLQEVEDTKDELELLNEQLQRLVLTDGLTGVSNRRHFDEVLNTFLDGYEKNHTTFSLLILDIDYFKKVNDTFGHQVGDFVLQELALKLQSATTKTGFVARIGGEEFAIILDGTAEQDAVQWAENLRSMVAQSAWIYTPITISAGVSEVNPNDTYSTILKRVDDALYKSKKLGRNRVSCANL